MSTQSKMTWCVIGAGGIADRRTIPALLTDPNNELVAVMDKSPVAAKATGEKKVRCALLYR